MTIKRIYRVEYAPGEFFDVPSYRLETETEQDLHTAFVDLTGASYAYDMLGQAPAPKKNAVERLSFLLLGSPGEINSTFESMSENLHAGARVTLWRRGEMDNGEYEDELVEETAPARLMKMPSGTLSVENRRHRPVTLIFERMADWGVPAEVS